MKRVIAFLLMAAMLICLCSCGDSSEDKYNRAVADVKAGKYDKAIAAFEALNGYQDSDKYIMYAKCLKAGDGGDYEAAIKSLKSLGDFKEASMYIKYYTALSYEADRKYEDARDVYDEILLFKDVQEHYHECNYQLTLQMVERRGSDAAQEAYDAFKTLGTYKDSAERARTYEDKYNNAVAKRSSGEYDAAIMLFAQLGTYSDAATQITETRYQSAVALMNDGKHEKAIIVFKTLNGYSDSATLITLCEDTILEQKYQAAIALMNDGRYSRAIIAFKELNGYSDSEAQITTCENAILEKNYQAAVALMNDGKYEKAISTFKALNGYSDSADQILECQYRKASKLLGEGNYADSYAIFITIKGYKDVDSLLVNDENLSAAREARWQAGNYVTFGSYPQTKAGNDDTPIEWLILARDGDKALVISRYALDCVKYDTTTTPVTTTSVTWETCSLRTWLNNDFYNKAFSAEEKESIVLSKVTADKNPSYSTNPGNDTNDNVFLLSIPEVNNYFEDKASRRCAPTDYAVKNGAWTDSSYKVDGRASCWWWVRSPGFNSHSAAGVDYDGFVNSFGCNVSLSNISVRPCVWVRLF